MLVCIILLIENCTMKTPPRLPETSLETALSGLNATFICVSHSLRTLCRQQGQRRDHLDGWVLPPERCNKPHSLSPSQSVFLVSCGGFIASEHEDRKRETVEIMDPTFSLLSASRGLFFTLLLNPSRSMSGEKGLTVTAKHHWFFT